MSLCGWNFASNKGRSPGEQAHKNIKVSLRYPQQEGGVRPDSHQLYKNQESYLTNTDTYKISSMQMQSGYQMRTAKKRSSFIDDLDIEETKNKIIQPYPNRQLYQYQQTPVKTTNTSYQQYAPTQNHHIPDNNNMYAQLLRQNHELQRENNRLNRIIEDQYRPLKIQYEKLKDQHEDRQFLISQLEWKVKELAKDLKNKKYSAR